MKRTFLSKIMPVPAAAADALKLTDNFPVHIHNIASVTILA